MAYVWCIVWAVSTLFVMIVTIKYYLPILSKRVQAVDSETLKEPYEDSSDSLNAVAKQAESENSFFCKDKKTLIVLILCSAFAGWCGFVAATHAVSTLSILKMTLAVLVLSGVFVTDTELMIIPNLSSLVLIIGRAITILCEFIWFRDEAVSWLVDSIIAMLASLILLVVMNKVTKGGLGYGDVKVCSSLGFLCGIAAVCFALMFALLICSAVSIVLLSFKKKKMRDALPLGPFIWMGFCVSVLLSII